MGTKLHVGNLNQKTTIEDLQNIFNRAGLVMSAAIPLNPKTGVSMGFGFVCMSSEESAQSALNLMNGYVLHDRQISVTEARE